MLPSVLFVIAAASVCALLPALAAEAAEVSEVAKLLASDGAAYDRFGVSVAVSSDTAVVGAWSDDDNGSESGSAYVFRYDDTAWVEEAKLTASDAAAGDNFGGSVAVSGDTTVVGSSGDDDNGSNSGSAYVYRYDGTVWVEEPKLMASDGAASDRFGRSVAVSGDTAVVVAIGDDNGNDSGSAYVFRYDGTGWVEEAKLTGAANGLFGSSVAVSGDTVVVGASQDDVIDFESGRAYVFRYDGTAWVEEAKPTASDGAAFDNFGYSVAVSGDTAVVGAPEFGDDGNGSAYVFAVPEPSIWALHASALAVLTGLARRGRRRQARCG